jgi:hypothetical protein
MEHKVTFSSTIVLRLKQYYEEELLQTINDEGFIVPNARRFLIRAGRRNITYAKQKEIFTHYEWAFDELLDIIQNSQNKFLIHESHHPFENLCQCIEQGKIEEAIELTKEVDYTINGSHIVFLAAKHGHLSLVQYFVALPRIDFLGDNPLIPACEFGHYEIVEILYKKGVDPSRDICLGIRLAIQNGYLDIVKLLLMDERIDITCRNNYALKKACEGGHYEVLKHILNNNKSADASVDNNHLLLIACQNNFEKIVKLLFTYPKVKVPVNGRLALQICGKGGSINILKMLLADVEMEPTREIIILALNLAVGKD